MFQVPQNYPTVVGFAGVSVSDDPEPGVNGAWTADDTRINRTYTNVLKVQTTDRTAGPLLVIGSLPCRIGDTYRFPLIGSTMETDTGSFLQSIRPERTTEDGGRQWKVTLEYAPFDIVANLGSDDISYGIIDPTARIWDVYWGEPAKYRKVKPYDESGEQENGDPGLFYVNTIKDPLLDPPDTEETRPVLFVVRNEATYNDAYASLYKDTTNAAEFLGYPPNCVKCRDIKGVREQDPDWGNPGWFFRVTYQFEFDDDDDGNGFTKEILDAGYRYKKGGTGTPINCVDGSGQPVNDAQLLAKNGDLIASGGTPYFIPFTEFPSADFTGLNIPDDLLYQITGNT